MDMPKKGVALGLELAAHLAQRHLSAVTHVPEVRRFLEELEWCVEQKCQEAMEGLEADLRREGAGRGRGASSGARPRGRTRSGGGTARSQQ